MAIYSVKIWDSITRRKREENENWATISIFCVQLETVLKFRSDSEFKDQGGESFYLQWCEDVKVDEMMFSKNTNSYWVLTVIGFCA